jgi:hypothetical protein
MQRRFSGLRENEVLSQLSYAPTDRVTGPKAYQFLLEWADELISQRSFKTTRLDRVDSQYDIEEFTRVQGPGQI